MPREDPTVTDLLDRLGSLDGVRARRMFGGHGIFLRGQIFAIVDEGRIYFKVDERLKEEFAALGSGPFTYALGKTISTYYELPVDILEETPRLIETAERSWRIASQKKTRARRPSAR